MKHFIIQFIFIYSSFFSKLIESQLALPKGCLNSFRQAALTIHNKYRAMHGSPLLSESNTIDTSAQEYATQVATTNVFAHSGNQLYGENLYGQFNPQNLTISMCSQIGTDCVTSWYMEISQYNYSNPGYSSSTGHFSQVVWKKSSSLGMGLGWGLAQNPFNAYYCVGQYSPPGNYANAREFMDNVLPLVSFVN